MKKQFTFWLPETIKEKLKKVADGTIYSMSMIVVIALEYLFTGDENGHVKEIRDAING